MPIAALLLKLATHLAVILLMFVTALVGILIAVKFSAIFWARYSQSARERLAGPLETSLNGDGNSFPMPFHQRRILQYMIIFKSFGKTGQEFSACADLYDKFGFIETDLRRLGSPFWWTRAEGARCLGQMRSFRAEASLMARLKDPVLEVRLMAAWALGRIGDAHTLVPCIEALVGASRLAGMRLCSTVFEWGRKAVPPLTQTLDHPDPAVRLLAIHLLGEMKSIESVGPIARKTDVSEDHEVRVAAFKALGTIGDASALDTLLPGLKDARWEVRAQAARSLGLLGLADTVSPLSEALKDPKWWVRRNAGEALTKLGEPGLRALRATHDDPSWPPAQLAAGQWLDELGLLPLAR